MIILDCLCWIYVVEFFPMSGLGDFYDDVYWSYDMYILEMYDFYPLRLLKNSIYACYLNLMCRRGVYFLNIYIIHVYYRLIEIGRYSWPDAGGVPELSGWDTPRCHWWWVWRPTYSGWCSACIRPGWHCSSDNPSDVTWSGSLSWRTRRYIYVGLLCQPCCIAALV